MIELVDVVKDHGRIRALDGVSLHVATGEVFGLLGHNGAGKTTAVRILTGRLHADAGHASVLGHDVRDAFAAVKPLIGVVFEDQDVYPTMSADEDLRFFARLRAVDPRRVGELLELVGLRDAAARRVSTYSTGMKQRLLIARALLNQPRALFLDEPTRGLDAAAARELRALIAGLKSEGTTILLTTHDLPEAEAVCDRVGILASGRLVAVGTPLELRRSSSSRRATVELRDGRQITIALDDPADGARVAAWIADGDVEAIHSDERSLSDVVVALAARPAE